MKFARNTEALIFVKLPPDITKTVFGSRKVFDLDIERKGATIVANSELHPTGSKRARICSFEIRLCKALSQMGSDEKQEKHEKQVGQLPIIFDYIDTDTDLSPLFERRRGQPIVGHGGIHPPTATTFIELIDETPEP